MARSVWVILGGLVLAAGQRGQSPGGWTTYNAPQGFSVQHPSGWSASADAKSGRVSLRGPQAQQVIVWPVFVPSALDAKSAAAVLHSSAGYLYLTAAPAAAYRSQ